MQPLRSFEMPMHSLADRLDQKPFASQEERFATGWEGVMQPIRKPPLRRGQATRLALVPQEHLEPTRAPVEAVSVGTRDDVQLVRGAVGIERVGRGLHGR